MLAKLLPLLPHDVEPTQDIVVVSMHADGPCAEIFSALVPILARIICVELETVGGTVGIFIAGAHCAQQLQSFCLLFLPCPLSFHLFGSSWECAQQVYHVADASIKSPLVSLHWIGELFEQADKIHTLPTSPVKGRSGYVYPAYYYLISFLFWLLACGFPPMHMLY